MAGKNTHRYEVKLYGIDAEKASGRAKIGETAIVEATDLHAATTTALGLIAEGIGPDKLVGLHSITVRLEAEKATVGNPFASASE